MTAEQLSVLRPGDRVHVSYASSSCHGGKITDVVTVDRVDGRAPSLAEDACAAVADALRLSGETYAEPDWNPDAHVHVTLTVAYARLVLAAARAEVAA